MNLKSLRKALISAYAAGNLALLSGITAFAAKETSNAEGGALDGLNAGLDKSFNDIIKLIQPIGYSVCIIAIIVLGISLIIGGDKAKEKVKSHIVLIVVGIIFVAGASTIAGWLQGNLGGNFTEG